MKNESYEQNETQKDVYEEVKHLLGDYHKKMASKDEELKKIQSETEQVSIPVALVEARVSQIEHALQTYIFEFREEPRINFSYELDKIMYVGYHTEEEANRLSQEFLSMTNKPDTYENHFKKGLYVIPARYAQESFSSPEYEKNVICDLCTQEASKSQDFYAFVASLEKLEECICDMVKARIKNALTAKGLKIDTAKVQLATAKKASETIENHEEPLFSYNQYTDKDYYRGMDK